MARPSPAHGAPSRSRRVALGVAALVLAAGLAHVARTAWIADDAYLSFRYAENLARGLGLVFNAGERVEGYSNFLWTVWLALGAKLGIGLERWAIGGGIACHAGILLVLLAWSWRRSARAGRSFVPVAALAIAAHRDAAVFGTSGLETPLVTLLALGGWALLAGARGRAGRAAAAGAVLGLAALTRPDGIVFTALGGAFVLFNARSRRATLAYAATAVAIVVPYAAWKLAYYGDLLPNTYYAKSGGLAWWSQGLYYAGLYARTYPVLLLAPVLAAVAAFRGAAGTADRRGWSEATLLAAAFALVPTLVVARVGGDFMFARLLIPATPFYALLLELALERLARGRTAARVAAAAIATASIALAPRPMRGDEARRGIVDEWSFYRVHDRAAARRLGERLAGYFDGLPVRIGFVGGQAILAYYSRAPVAIETATGLTDSLIAHQPLVRRGRVGHEKPTPIPYVVERRRLDLWLFTTAAMRESLAAWVPVVPVGVDTLECMVPAWNPAVMRALRARGARVPDFEALLDQAIARLPELSDGDARALYARCRRFYFAGTSDPRREAAFLARLRRADETPVTPPAAPGAP